MFEEAVIRARKCDEERERYKERKCWKFGDDLAKCHPPFFGVPISLK